MSRKTGEWMFEEEAETEYEKLKAYWEAWKANNKRPSDQQESEFWDEMVDIFRAIAGQSSAKPNAEALNFVKKARPRWLSQLRDSANWDKPAERVRLYRGVVDCAAILLRKRVKDATPIHESELMPICYTTDIEVALGFARKGHIDGCVYSILAPLDSVVFADLDGLYREGGAHKEKEVVVLHNAPITINVIDPNVAPQKHIPHNRRARDNWELKKQRLEEKEKGLNVVDQ